MCTVTSCTHRIETPDGYVCTATGAVLGLVILNEPYGANRNAQWQDGTFEPTPTEEVAVVVVKDDSRRLRELELVYTEIMRKLFKAGALADMDLHIEAYCRELVRLRTAYDLRIHHVPFVLAILYMLRNGFHVRDQVVMRKDPALDSLLPNVGDIEQRGFQRRELNAGEKVIRAKLAPLASVPEEWCVRPHTQLMRDLCKERQAASVGVKRFKLSPRGGGTM